MFRICLIIIVIFSFYVPKTYTKKDSASVLSLKMGSNSFEIKDDFLFNNGQIYIGQRSLNSFLDLKVTLNILSNKITISSNRFSMHNLMDTNYISFGGKIYYFIEPVVENNGFFYFSEKFIKNLLSKAFTKHLSIEKGKVLLKKQNEFESENSSFIIKPKDCFQNVVIDPGHGGEDEGAVFGKYKEKEIVLQISKRLKTVIENNSPIKVFLTRNEDKFIPLKKRTLLGDTLRANLFISIHLNFSDDSDAKGFEVFILDPDTTDKEAAFIARVENSVLRFEKEGAEKIIIDDILADITVNSFKEDSMRFAEILISSNKIFKSRGVKQAPFVALMGLNMPSVLLELGFISNIDDRKKLTTTSQQDKMVKSILYSIMEFKEKYNSKYCPL